MMTNRRNFVRGASSLAALSALGLGQDALEANGREAPNQGAPSSKPWLAHVYLDGGPDFRHLIVPRYSENSADFGHHYWLHRFAAWGLNSLAEVPALLEQCHFTTYAGVELGFHPKADWLAQQWQKGNLAVVNNVVGSTNRNHEWASIIMETGHEESRANDRQRSGWGGRLAAAQQQNVLALTSRVRQFCFGPHAQDERLHDNALVISAKNMRQFGLYKADGLVDDPNKNGHRENMSRALSSYYQAKAKVMASNSPYRKFIEHQKKLSEQGELVRARLATVEHSAEMQALLDGELSLNNKGFARQCLNLFDATACQDILNANIASLDYGGWDSHRDQASKLNTRFHDLFSLRGGLSVTQTALSSLDSQVHLGMTWMLSGEFGRQLKANGDGGTDHGRGNSVLFIGEQVKGGLYGELYPQDEIAIMDKAGKDILGQTHMEQVIAKVCDRFSPGSSAQVVPLASTRSLETSNNLDFI